MVLYVDQFEELFTLTTSEDERRHFIDLLTTAVTEPDGSLIVILSLRADFYNRPLEYNALGSLVKVQTVPVLPMALADLYDVIEQPARRDDVRVTFEDGLVTDILFTVRDEIGALPLLQFALDQLFEQRSGLILTRAAYKEMGGIRGALTKHAEQTYHNLPSDEHRHMARALFLRLIEPGATEQDTTRRRAGLHELTLPDAEQTKILKETAAIFIDGRLLVSDRETIEVAHEALIREWGYLSDWIRIARNDIRLQQRIVRDANEWHKNERRSDDLYRGLKLKEADDWAKRNLASALEIEFIEAGKYLEEFEQFSTHRAKQLELLTKISSRIIGELERDDVVKLALAEMTQLFSYDTMTFWRRNASQMVLEGARGPHTDPSDAGLVIRINEYDVVKAMVDSQRVILGNESAERIADGLYGSSFARSWLGVPLVNQGHVVGMITLASNTSNMYTNLDDQNLAFTFATQIAIAMANAELFEQTFDRTNELGILLEAAQATSHESDLNQIFRIVVELMFNALEIDECAILIWDQVKNTLDVQIDMNRNSNSANTLEGTTLNLKQHPAKRHALQQREVVLVTHNDRETPYPDERAALEEAGIGARMLVPLVVREESIGLIVLGQQQVSELGISMQKIRLARALGSQVAIAIENARLSTSMSSMLDESMIVNDLASALSSTLNLDDAINIMRRQMPRVTQAEHMYLALYDAQTQMITFPMAVSEGKDISIAPRLLGDDEVSFVLRHNRILTIGADDFTIEELRHNLHITNGEGEYASYLAVPLSVSNQAFGVLAMRDSKMSAFTMNHQRVLTTVAAQLSAVIQNANLFNQVQSARQGLEMEVEERTRALESERDRLDTLYQIKSELSRSLDMQRVQQRALDMVVKAVGGEDGVILSINPVTDSLYLKATLNPASLNKYQQEGLLHPAVILGEWLIQHYSDVLIDDLHTFEYWDATLPDAQNWRSAMAVVLESNENDPQGVMVIFSSQVNAFTESEQRLLVAAANQVAEATNNADLYNLIRDQADRLGGLLRTEQDEAEKNASILASISDGVMQSDSNGKIVLLNSAAERILDISRELALNQSLDKLKTLSEAPDIIRWTQRIQHYTEHHEDFADSAIQERLYVGNRIIQVDYSPIYTGERFLGILSVFRDITWLSAKPD